MMNFRNIACCLIVRTNHLSKPPLVLISSDNRRSTVFQIIITNEVPVPVTILYAYISLPRHIGKDVLIPQIITSRL